jgi:hypothetical protein
MLLGSFPDPDPADDSGEPHGGPEPGGGLRPDGLGDEAAQRGLFLSVPAGHFDPDRFTQSGPAAGMPPDALLATIMDTVTSPDGPGVGGLGDDQLIGVIAAARRLESRAAWCVLAAEAEFTARSAGEESGPHFAADELACELHLTAGSAAGQMEYAGTVTVRLPQCLAALYDGRMHPVHLRIIEEETRIVSAADAAEADAVLAGIAGSLTYGKLRPAVHRLVLELDPESVQRRKDAGRRNTQVRPFREDSGNAGLIGRELPCDEVLASWQHLEQRALDLRAAGVPGALRELRVRAYLDLLQERDTRLDPAVPDPAAGGSNDTGTAGNDDGGTGTAGNDGSTHGPDGNDDDNGPGGNDDDNGPGGGNAPGPASGPGGSSSSPQPGAGPGPSLAALVSITIPWSTCTGRSDGPADVGGFGVTDAADARDLAAAAARDPRTRWCVTMLNPDGTAAAHGCVPGRHPPPGLHNLTVAPGPAPPPGTSPHEWISALGIQLTSISRGTCSHEHAEPGLPAQPETPAPDPRPQRPLHRAGLRPARGPLRPGPHPGLGTRRPDLRMRPRPALPPPPPLQTSSRVAAGTARTRCPDLAHPSRTHLHHHTHPIPRLAIGHGFRQAEAGGQGEPAARARRAVAEKVPELTGVSWAGGNVCGVDLSGGEA